MTNFKGNIEALMDILDFFGKLYYMDSHNYYIFYQEARAIRVCTTDSCVPDHGMDSIHSLETGEYFNDVQLFIYSCSASNEEIFLQNFLKILKLRLQNFQKILKIVSWGLET